MNTNMNKRLIRLTESDLHRIVKESVQKILKEIVDTVDGGDSSKLSQPTSDDMERQSRLKKLPDKVIQDFFRRHKCL